MATKQNAQTGIKASVGKAQVQLLRNNPEVLRRAISSEIKSLSKLTNKGGDVAFRANARIKQLNNLMKTDVQLTQGTIRLLGSQLISEAASLAGSKIAADAATKQAGFRADVERAKFEAATAKQIESPKASVSDLINGSAVSADSGRDQSDDSSFAEFYGYAGR